VYLEGQFDRYAGDFCGAMRARATLMDPSGGVTVYLLASLIDGTGSEHDGPWVTVSPGTTKTSTSSFFATSCGAAHIWLSFPTGGVEGSTATTCR
jgi:hypothetical protein